MNLSLITPLISLLFICIGCGVLLTKTEEHTKAAINHNRAEKAQALYLDMVSADVLKQMPNNSAHINPHLGGCANHVLFKHQVSGYSGNIHLVVVWHNQTMAMRVNKHLETPGIGDFIDHRKSDWLKKRDYTNLTSWQALDNVSGATITTSAIKQAAAESYALIEILCNEANDG